MYPSQQNATDQTANFFWVLVMIIGAILIVWWLVPQYIIRPIFWLRMHEIDFLVWLMKGWNSVALDLPSLHLPMAHTGTLQKLHAFMAHVDPKTLIFDDFAAANNYVGKWLRYPIGVILLACAAIVHLKGGSHRYRNIYNMQKLRKKEEENWPEIAPVVSFDLVKTDIDKGPWAMAKVPLDFCKENDIGYITEIDQRTVWAVDKGKAQRLFTMQLGPLWSGADKLPIHMKALLVIFVARAERDRDVANKLLAQIAASASSGKLDFTGVEEHLQKYKHSKVVKWLMTRHAYVFTLMASMLEIARTDGVLATAEFLWLKPVDRRFWYMMNSVGRQTSVIEVAGPFSHWLAEKKIGRAMKSPMLTQAVEALEEKMNDTLYVSDEAKWHTYKEA